jgi:putative ABC transport system permease protein
VFARILGKLSGITRFFTLFSIIAGILILISSVLATQFARIQEAVYFKILGAQKGFILKVFALENGIVGLLSGLIALLLSQTGSWIISRWIFDIPYHPFLLWSLFMVLSTLMLVVAVGLVSSISILTQKPVVFLREQTEE